MADSNSEFSDGIPPYVRKRELPQEKESGTTNSPTVRKMGIVGIIGGAFTSLLLAFGLHQSSNPNAAPTQPVPVSTPEAKPSSINNLPPNTSEVTLTSPLSSEPANLPKTGAEDEDKTSINLFNPNVPYGDMNNSNSTPAQRAEKGEPALPGLTAK